MSKILTLVLPGLAEQDLAAYARIRRFIARSQLHDIGLWSYEQSVLHALGYESPDVTRLPAARCSYIADFNESAANSCCRADPISLHAEQQDARLVPVELLQLADTESTQIIADLNAHLNADGLRLVQGKKQRWYLIGAPVSSLTAAPVSQLAGRAVGSFMTVHGNEHTPDSAVLQRLGSELQMLLHDHPVNQQRVSAGQQPVNALWLWGGAPLPERQHKPAVRVYSDTAYVVGAARLSETKAFPLAEALPAIRALRSGRWSAVSSREQSLVVDTRLLESVLSMQPELAARVLAEIEQQWMPVLFRTLMLGSLREVIIDTCANHRLHVTRASLLRFWAKARRLTADSNSLIAER